jgi:hypothetical protein
VRHILNEYTNNQISAHASASQKVLPKHRFSDPEGYDGQLQRMYIPTHAHSYYRLACTYLQQSKTLDEQWTAVNYDVPDNEANICRIRFYVNTDIIKKAPLSLEGEAPFAINISRIESKLVNGGTTWNNKPTITEHYDTYVLSKNGATEVVSKWFQCPKGDVAQFVIHPAGKRDLKIYWFELDYGAVDGGPHGVVLEMHT